ncbi:MAG: FecR family protein [Chitinophaga sp.]|uniref:FecR family protein n=1 Tax=Chitinophaga sp. TaxID=1869181 RepID=UPI001B12B083|nr:FecR family protein [Chitinophaga sp.]MBO9728734.1 FecR family protein [Chitinophaga sp.]
MKSERIAALLAKRAGQAATIEELEELDRLLAADREAAWLAGIVDAVGTRNEDAATTFATAGWEQVAGKLTVTPAPLRRKAAFWWAAAAIIGVILSAGIGWQMMQQRKTAPLAAARQQLAAPLGKTVKALLPDGTIVWLNAGSNISYDAGFNHNNRNITVTGEIFLDVTKNEALPFIVHTSNMDVHVLGTCFNIKAYEDDTRSEVTVIGGKVQVIMRNSPEKKVILLPHEKLVLAVKPNTTAAPQAHVNFQVQGLAGTADTSLVMETAWRDQKLAFMNETFEEVARKMERQFNVTISFEDENMKREILSGVFEKENINKALQLLQMITPFHYSIDQQHVYLSK